VRRRLRRAAQRAERAGENRGRPPREPAMDVVMRTRTPISSPAVLDSGRGAAMVKGPVIALAGAGSAHHRPARPTKSDDERGGGDHRPRTAGPGGDRAVGLRAISCACITAWRCW